MEKIFSLLHSKKYSKLRADARTSIVKHIYNAFNSGNFTSMSTTIHNKSLRDFMTIQVTPNPDRSVNVHIICQYRNVHRTNIELEVTLKEFYGVINIILP